LLTHTDLNHVLLHTGHLMEPLRGKTIFLTGATGFFGKWMMETFMYMNDSLKLGARVIALSRDPGAFLATHAHFDAPAIHFLKGDVRSFTFPQENIDYIIHAAADMKGYGNRGLAEDLYDSIVSGTRRVLDLAAANKVASVLHTSSGAVYGSQPTYRQGIPETYSGAPDPQSAAAPYGEGKRVAEMMAGIYFHNHGVASKIARCFAFVGPYFPVDGTFAAGNFIKDAIAGRDINISGDGTPERSYLYAADLAIWLWTILLAGKNCYPYNVGSDEPLSLVSLAGMIAAKAVRKDTSVHVTKQPGSGPYQQYIPDIKRAREELNLNVYIGPEEAISRTMNFYTRKNIT